MKRALFTLILVLISTQGTFASISVTSTQFQVDASGMINPSMLITGATPWDFTSTSYLSLNSIDEISVTLSLLDGDTATPPVDIDDRGQLMLELDGLNTGLALDGFANDVITTHTVTGANLNANVLNALQIDGYLLGSILDLTPNDNYVRVVDGEIYPEGPLYSATLTLTDHELSVVPVPSAILLGGLGVAVTTRLKRKRLLGI